MISRRPVIGISADRRMIGHHPFHMAGEKYITAVAEGAGGVPVLLPALGDGSAIEEVLRHLDGIVLPGSATNVEPHRYAGNPSVAGTLHDPDRDATAGGEGRPVPAGAGRRTGSAAVALSPRPRERQVRCMAATRYATDGGS